MTPNIRLGIFANSSLPPWTWEAGTRVNKSCSFGLLSSPQISWVLVKPVSPPKRRRTCADQWGGSRGLPAGQLEVEAWVHLCSGSTGAALSLCICNSCWCTLPPPAWLVVQQYPTSHNYPQCNKIQNTPLILQWKMRSNCVPGKWGFAFQVLDGGYLLKIGTFYEPSIMEFEISTTRWWRHDPQCNVRWSHMQEGRQSVHYCHTNQNKSPHFILFQLDRSINRQSITSTSWDFFSNIKVGFTFFHISAQK